jgi:acid phosphatase type 7
MISKLYLYTLESSLFKTILSICSLCLCLISTTHAGEISFSIPPYIQEMSSTGLKIRWEKTLDSGTTVRVGKLNSENELEFSATLLKKEVFRIHRKKAGLYESEIEGLLPNTNYYYKIISGDDQSSVFNFKTLNNNRESFSFLVMADAQHGHQVTTRIIQESVIYHTFVNNPDRESFPPRFSLFPGDLVQHGILKRDWKKHFFKPLAPLLHRLAVYPVKGNHEMGRFYFNKFFSLPRQTSLKPNYNYYFFDYSNVRFINLDTNRGYRNKKQLKWLELALKEAEKDDDIDFIIIQFHHPYKSEAWTWGNTKFTGEVEQVLEKSSRNHNKPLVYFNGHTHAYSRGHKMNSRLSMVTVGPIGGAIDQWSRKSKDYQDYHVTLSQYGWIMVKVNADEKNPSLEIKRYGFGSKKELLDTGIVDRFTIRKNSSQPEKPSISDIQSDKNQFQITTTPYENAEPHLTTQIKFLHSNKRGKSSEKYHIFNRNNIYAGVDHRLTDDLTKLPVKIDMGKKESVHIQVRYRNDSLIWSEWSDQYKLPNESTADQN